MRSDRPTWLYIYITFCINTGEFIGDSLLTDIGDAGDFERINGHVPFNVTVGCLVAQRGGLVSSYPREIDKHSPMVRLAV